MPPKKHARSESSTVQSASKSQRLDIEAEPHEDDAENELANPEEAAGATVSIETPVIGVEAAI